MPDTVMLVHLHRLEISQNQALAVRAKWKIAKLMRPRWVYVTRCIVVGGCRWKIEPGDHCDELKIGINV